MDEVHRELLKKRQKYILDNVIMEEGLMEALKEKGVFTSGMLHVLMNEKDPERQMIRLLDMVPKRGPDAYEKFMDCLRADYPWVVENFREKEEELQSSRQKADILPEVRRAVKEQVKELAKTSRINLAQQKSIEEFLCRNLTSAESSLTVTQSKLPSPRLFSLHKQLISAVPVASLDESDQMGIRDVTAENVTLDKIEKEVTLLVERINDLQITIDGCYEKLGEPNREKELPDLVYTLRKLFLEKEIRYEEMKNQLMSLTRQLRLAKDKSRKAVEAHQKNEEEKEDLAKSLDVLKIKIHKLQEERQKMGMKVAFDSASTMSNNSPAPSSLDSSRTRSSRSRRHDDRMSQRTFDS